MEPYIGQIMMVGFNYAPPGWALCNGQLIPISQNTSLFSLLGTQFGGDGRSTFGLPDLRGRAPMHYGSGPGLSNRTIGEKGGTETVTLTVNEMPNHNHQVKANNSSGRGGGATSSDPTAHLPGYTESPVYSEEAPNSDMNNQMISSAGGNQGHSNMPPFQVVNFLIALEGIYPAHQ